MARFAALLLAVQGSDAARKERADAELRLSMNESDGEPGYVSNLLTYGAPMVSAPALTNPRSDDGCFPGYRYVARTRYLNPTDQWDVDIVPPLLTFSRYAHPSQDIWFMQQRNHDRLRDCGWRGLTQENPSILLHMHGLYVRRASARDSPFKEAAQVALAVSYTFDPTEASNFVAEFGYRLVGTALRGEEASHLIQHETTKACYITFEGSTEFDDWRLNAQIGRTDFCGLEQRVHTGFAQATMRITTTEAFQNNVRPRLGRCSSVEAVGHSLGGAMASLFTACAHNTVSEGDDGFDEYKYIEWKRQTPQLMPSV
jgi:hypothetical protein